MANTTGKKFGGREKGTQNKATISARAAIAEFVEGNVGRLNGLLDAIEADDGPQAAWDCIVDVLEYHVPKLSRADIHAETKGTLTVEIVRFGEQDKDPGE